MKKSQLLKEAKKVLWQGVEDGEPFNKESMVCLALRKTTVHLGRNCDVDVGPIEDELTDWIHLELMELGFLCTLEDWLEIHHPEFPRNNTRKMQQLRHKWVDWMIQYWEERGD